ncbi:MAG: 1-acyl-sn-glycerol-3-phosphate acyltransferase [Clostridia bacterium]|nr:1-acyl-sn-glycerol-3-phosphate acyltransferase [Clostridia bacterium]
MLRFIYVIIVCTGLIIYYVPKMIIWSKHPEKHTEEERYGVTQKMVNHIRKRARIETKVFGTEKLPRQGGYIIYSNHQGKYDALGIMYAHEQPCTVLMNEKRSKMPIANQFIDFIGAKRLDPVDLRKQIKVFNEIGDEVKNGRRYIIFPEGKYDDNGNNLQEFFGGCFRCSLRSERPIVPVMLFDSYKPFSINSLKKVTTEVHFLDAIPFEDYKDMRPADICNLVKNKIQDAMDERNAV